MSDGRRREVVPITSRGQWLAARQGLITASIGAALFDRPFITRAELAGILRGENQQGDNPAMRRGRILESAVAAAVMEERPDWLLRKATTFHTLPDHRVGATPDYVIDHDGRVINVQCKTVNPSVFDRQWHGAIPLGYSIQVVIENLCLDSVTGYLAVLVTNSGFDLHIREVPRHAAVEQMFLDAAAAWFREHDAGRLPEAAPSEAIAAAYDDGSSVDLSSNNRLCEALPVRERLKAEIGAAEKQVAEIDAALKDAMGTASVGWLPGYNISFKAQTRKEVVIPAKTFRVLRVAATENA